MGLSGLNFHIMKRKGGCSNCRCDLNTGDKSVVIGSFSNKYRYCTTCFLKVVELEFNLEILDFIGDKYNGLQ